MKTELTENIPTYTSDTMLAFIDILGFKQMLSKKSFQTILYLISTSHSNIRFIPFIDQSSQICLQSNLFSHGRPATNGWFIGQHRQDLRAPVSPKLTGRTVCSEHLRDPFRFHGSLYLTENGTLTSQKEWTED